jgi:prepilin-type N-terminal cleavage/methylation domain-containing protein
MNPAVTAKGKQAFTLIELLVVIAIIATMVALLGPALYQPSGPKPTQAMCKNNLKQIGLGFWLYHQDNTGHSPWPASVAAGNRAADYFLKLTSDLHQPNIFICPSDTARQAAATNYSGFNNTNLSYFASLHGALVLTSSPAILVLAGDRHLAVSNQPVRTGLFNLPNTAAMSWTKELHFSKDSVQTVGILLFADGHVARTPTEELPEVLAKPDLPATRMLIP